MKSFWSVVSSISLRYFLQLFQFMDQSESMKTDYLSIQSFYYAVLKVKKVKLFLYSAVSSPWDCSKPFTLHPLADRFIPTPTQHLWEASIQPCSNYCTKTIRSHICTTVYSQVFKKYELLIQARADSRCQHKHIMTNPWNQPV